MSNHILYPRYGTTISWDILLQKMEVNYETQMLRIDLDGD